MTVHKLARVSLGPDPQRCKHHGPVHRYTHLTIFYPFLKYISFYYTHTILSFFYYFFFSTRLPSIVLLPVTQQRSDQSTRRVTSTFRSLSLSFSPFFSPSHILRFSNSSPHIYIYIYFYQLVCRRRATLGSTHCQGGGHVARRRTLSSNSRACASSKTVLSLIPNVRMRRDIIAIIERDASQRQSKSLKKIKQRQN